MRRIASHYTYYGRLLRMHYVELADNGTLGGVYPLTEEIAGTEFYDGILLLLPAGRKLSHSDELLISSGANLDYARKEALLARLESLHTSCDVKEGMPVGLILLNGSPLTATELRTDNSSRDRDV